MHQQLWGYKVEGKLYVGVREQKTLNTAVLDYTKDSINKRSVHSVPSVTVHVTCCVCGHYFIRQLSFVSPPCVGGQRSRLR